MYDKAKKKDLPQACTPVIIQFPKMTLTVEQLAIELNVSLPTAYNLVKEEGFPSLNIGHRVLINREGLQRWLDSKCNLQLIDTI